MLGSEKGKPNYGEISPWPSGRNFYFREPNTRGVNFVAHVNVLDVWHKVQCHFVPKYRFEKLQLENVFMEKAQKHSFFG